MKKVLFIDRDGTIIAEPEDEQVDSLEKFSFIPGVITALANIVRETDFELVMVTNQDGLGTPSFPEENFRLVQDKMLQILEGEGVKFAEIFIDNSFPEDKAPTRKPGTAMLVKYLAGGINLENSFVIGDRDTDIQLAKNIGCNAIYFNEKESAEAILSTIRWEEICRFLQARPRRSVISRKTGETDISIELNLDGTGISEIGTEIPFFDHMLDQIARHGSFDIRLKASGDTCDEGHHLIEDVSICLGDAFRKALGYKKGIERYSFVLPMDDCLAQVAVDLGGRPWLIWNVDFADTRIGGIPSEMFMHFFKSFSDNAKCNLNIKADGINDHHKIEAVFKAFARALKNAVIKSGSAMPSTKGVL